MSKQQSEEQILVLHGMFNPTLEKLLKCPVPFSLQMYGGGEYVAKWEPQVPTDGLPKVVTGTSRTSAYTAMIRFYVALYEAGVLA